MLALCEKDLKMLTFIRCKKKKQTNQRKNRMCNFEIGFNLDTGLYGGIFCNNTDLMNDLGASSGPSGHI